MEPHEITQLLHLYASGDRQALNQLMPLVWNVLHPMAEREMRKESRWHTLQPTELISEVFLRLAQGTPVFAKDRVHFFNLVGRIMSHLRYDYARRRDAARRGGGAEHVTWSDAEPRMRAMEGPYYDVDLERALNKLEEYDPMASAIVHMRYTLGMTEDEIVRELGVSRSTVQELWRFARAWLFDQLRPNQPPLEPPDEES